jgi:hypothetical protein
MWKWLTCKLSGSSCAWKIIRTEKYVRGAYGMFVNVSPPQVKCEVYTQQCVSCGKLRTREVQVP